MKIGLVGDIHWSRYSSILRLRGNKFSYRLENCAKSINWAEQLFSYNNCSAVIYLGDFFDNSELNSEEISALQEIEWEDIPHYFLVGNHEMGINDLSYASTNVFKLTNSNIISHPETIYNEHFNLVFLPYILEDNRKDFIDYLPDNKNKTIVFSHNDLAGIQMGKFLSKSGFNIDDIQNNCDLFINGHLHNGGKVADRVINIGNLTGQNFSEDASVYDHVVFILDTDTLRCEVYENPYAINFYKLSEEDLNTVKIKDNAVLTIRCKESNKSHVQNMLDSMSNILTYRIIIVPEETKTLVNNNKELISINHVDKFNEFVINTLGSSDIVMEELGALNNGN